MRTAGIHHVTAMASDAQANRDFYEGVLGLRLVKQTVNFDDPGTYHLYYGDALGNPGTILTFFPIPGLSAGQPGAGTTDAVVLAVPVGSLGAWQERLSEVQVASALAGSDDDRRVLAFSDPDGMGIELIESERIVSPSPWSGGVASEHAIQGVAGVRLASRNSEATHQALQTWLGLEQEASGVFRATERLGGQVSVRDASDEPRVRLGAGSVHHIAFRTSGAEEQRQWGDHLRRTGANPTSVQDRDYFTSIYFREPGGVLLELATDGPGFTRDEPAEELGSALHLPAWLAQHRARIEEVLPPLLPSTHGVLT
jgi:glyoxalase family protein